MSRKTSIEMKSAHPITMKKRTGLIATIAITVLFAVLRFYFKLPPINLKSWEFWRYLFDVAMVYAVLRFLRLVFTMDPVEVVGEESRGKKMIRPFLIAFGFLILPVVLWIITSSPLFHAKAYSNILTVNEGSIEVIPSAESTDSIALMDTNSAIMLGSREMGSLTDVISQYDVQDYTQIAYQGFPVKTAALKYASFFKWVNNRDKGVPGYVMVDPVSMSASYHSLTEGMKYVPSAYFSEYLKRHIRFTYPTAMFDNLHFEVDEEGRPYYVASEYTYQVGLFGGKQVVGAIVIDPVSGDMNRYSVSNTPAWVDVVFHGDLICQQYNDYGMYQSGFFNSIIGQSGCRKVTYALSGNEEEVSTYSDYGYVAKDGDIWIYTGVTSVTNDSSNIGFILSNERTEETIMITCAGADEFSAMASAQGEVQEKGYVASFPSLILIDGAPTYIMVLKDAAGLVKMFAAVNVEQYNMVATGSSQADCIAKYKALLSGKISQSQATGSASEEDESDAVTDLSSYEKKTITVIGMKTLVRGGDSYLYLIDENETIYCAKYEDVIPMLLVKEGDTVTILTDGAGFVLPKE